MPHFVTLSVTMETRQELNALKLAWRCKTMDEVLRRLMQGHSLEKLRLLNANATILTSGGASEP